MYLSGFFCVSIHVFLQLLPSWFIYLIYYLLMGLMGLFLLFCISFFDNFMGLRWFSYPPVFFVFLPLVYLYLSVCVSISVCPCSFEAQQNFAKFFLQVDARRSRTKQTRKTCSKGKTKPVDNDETMRRRVNFWFDNVQHETRRPSNKGEMVAQLTGLWFFHSVSSHYCRKVRPGHAKCCACHAWNMLA